MAEAPVSTKAPGGIPESGQVKAELSNTFAPAAGNPTFAGDPTYIEAVAKNNHARAGALIEDNEILPGRYSEYENQLRAGEVGENKGFTALGGRTMARGAANSGFATTERQNLAAGYQLRKNLAAERFTENIGGIKRRAANQAWRLQEGLQNAGVAAEGRRAREIAKTPNEAPPPPPAAAGTGATAAVNAAFPGGRNAAGETHDEWVKNNSKYVRNPFNFPLVNRAGGAPQRAKGGPVKAGKPYVVGEEGPEVMIPKTGGQILPNHAQPKAQQIRRRAIERLGRWNGGRNQR